MFTAEDITPLNAVKKEAGTGSYRGMRWRIEKEGDGEMKVTIYPEPKSFACTPEEEKESRTFELSAKGREQAVEWLQEQYLAQKARWDSAPRI